MIVARDWVCGKEMFSSKKSFKLSDNTADSSCDVIGCSRLTSSSVMVEAVCRDLLLPWYPVVFGPMESPRSLLLL